MKYVLSYIIFAFASFSAFAQNMSIMGKVTDENGKPVGNVHIVVDGNLGEAISETSGYYRLALLSIAKSGQEITLRIEDKTFESFTVGIVAGTQVKDIPLVHKNRTRVAEKNKDSAKGSSRTEQSITLDHPTFNGPAQIGNYNTQNIVNPSVSYIPMSDSLRIAVMMNLSALKKQYPNATPILVKFDNGSTRSDVAKALGELLEATSLGKSFPDGSNWNDNEHPWVIQCAAEDTVYVTEFMNAISPMLRTKWGFHDLVPGLRPIYMHINGTPYFRQDGSFVIK